MSDKMESKVNTMKRNRMVVLYLIKCVIHFKAVLIIAKNVDVTKKKCQLIT